MIVWRRIFDKKNLERWRRWRNYLNLTLYLGELGLRDRRKVRAARNDPEGFEVGFASEIGGHGGV